MLILNVIVVATNGHIQQNNLELIKVNQNIFIHFDSMNFYYACMPSHSFWPNALDLKTVL